MNAAEQCLALLLKNQKTIAFAESCTGGLLAKMLTDLPGASAAFECGVVSYSGRIKHKLLGVSEETLRRFGEVSPQTASEMAEGIVAASGADIGVSITGIAGPTGATETKRVGLIYIGVSFLGHTSVDRLELYDGRFDRAARREAAAAFALKKVSALLSEKSS